MKIGTKVICIDDSYVEGTAEELKKDCPNWVKKGQTYTIRAIQDWDFVVGLLLEEIKNEPKYFKVVNKFAEPSFASWRFRELKENEVEVKQLEEVLI